MKKEFNWRDYDDYSKWLCDVLTTLSEDNEKLQNDIYILLDVINKNVKELDCNDVEFKTITYYIDKINKKGSGVNESI